MSSARLYEWMNEQPEQSSENLDHFPPILKSFQWLPTALKMKSTLCTMADEACLCWPSPAASHTFPSSTLMELWAVWPRSTILKATNPFMSPALCCWYFLGPEYASLGDSTSSLKSQANERLSQAALSKRLPPSPPAFLSVYFLCTTHH